MDNNNKKRALGKGLEQLFSNERLDLDQLERKIVEETKESDIVEISIDEIRSNPYQPRKSFDEETLNELASSIKEHGVIQPIIVKKSIRGYEIVAGERRAKASRIAGMKTIPAIIKNFDDKEMMEIALVENIQRENLNPIEEAKALDIIKNTYNYTQDDLSQKFSKSRSYITNILGLLRLPISVQDMVSSNLITMGHARVLSKLSDENLIIDLAEKVIKEKMSVRNLENLTSTSLKKVPIKRNKEINNNYNIIQFDSEKDLERILEILNIEVDKD